MFKGALCLMVIFACGSLGLLKAQTYSQRLADLKDLKDMLRILQTEISYRKDPLPAAFARMASYKDTKAMNLLYECSRRMQDCRDLRQCWEEAEAAAYRATCMNGEDRRIVKDLGLQLGKSDVQGQAAMFALAEAKLSSQMEEAAKEKETKGRMYKGIGFSVGIVISIILI